MCMCFSMLEEIVIEALALSYCGEHVGEYANMQLLAEAWKMTFKILVPVQIRDTAEHWCDAFLSPFNSSAPGVSHKRHLSLGVTQQTEKSPVFIQVQSSECPHFYILLILASRAVVA